MNLRILTITGTSIALAAAVLLSQGPALAYESPLHTFFQSMTSWAVLMAAPSDLPVVPA